MDINRIEELRSQVKDAESARDLYHLALSILDEIQKDLEQPKSCSSSKLCSLCGKFPGDYAGWCLECMRDHDL